MKQIRVFFSWQSDLPKETNSSAIRVVLKEAIASIDKNNSDISLLFDEATRGESGSPDITKTILKKISESDVFVCDITTINSKIEMERKVPNPNVLIELGYAIAILGWDRIIMLFNTNHGSFPNDLPFDLDRRRVTKFSIIDNNDTNGKGDLKIKLTKAIELIIKINPQKPAIANILSPEQIQRMRDIKSIESVLSTLHLSSLDIFFEQFPQKFSPHMLTSYLSFNSVVCSSEFYIYDESLRELISGFNKIFTECFSYRDRFFQKDGSTDFSFFMWRGTDFPNDRAEADYYLLSDRIIDLQSVLINLLDHVRRKYIEVDIEALNGKTLARLMD